MPYQNGSFCLVFVPLTAFAQPEGMLYWAMDEYPEQYFQYTSDEATYNGAISALDYGCRQFNGGSGTYTGTIKIFLFSVATELLPRPAWLFQAGPLHLYYSNRRGRLLLSGTF